MKVTFNIPDNAKDIVLSYNYKTPEGVWVCAGKTYVPKRCARCEEINHDCMYGTNPPEYKCEKYGCIVSVDSICNGETNAEKQEQGKASQ